eukprot:TRINITY_DN2250_c2_g1_i1.p2 TRINITY_DN2250_c2_g1~~TRINITY_DN2250_c2_g1_i1.p2  ORF type:complete len:250 (-),score=93.47 TRINITY_DN2250_c2_g1_i1:526-1275(-)
MRRRLLCLGVALHATCCSAGLVFDSTATVRGTSGAIVTSYALSVNGAAVATVANADLPFTVPPASLPAAGSSLRACLSSADLPQEYCLTLPGFAPTAENTFFALGKGQAPVLTFMSRSTARDAAAKAEGKDLIYIENTRVMNNAQETGVPIRVRRADGAADVIVASIPFLGSAQIELSNTPSPLRIEAVNANVATQIVGTASLVVPAGGALLKARFGGDEGAPIVSTSATARRATSSCRLRPGSAAPWC